MAKGITNTMWVVIASLVILIVALVVLTIFSGGLRPIQPLTSFAGNCQVQARTSCQSIGILPVNWEIPVPVNDGGQQKLMSCRQAVSGSPPSGEVGCATYQYAVPKTQP